MTTTALGAELTAAIAARDATAIAACFADDVEFRALTPRGLRERAGAAETAALIEGWFADSTEFELVESSAEEIGDRLRVTYRFQGVEDDEAFALEQHLYCSVEDGHITRADLLCSGFRPRTPPAS